MHRLKSTETDQKSTCIKKEFTPTNNGWNYWNNEQRQNNVNIGPLIKEEAIVWTMNWTQKEKKTTKIRWTMLHQATHKMIRSKNTQQNRT